MIFAMSGDPDQTPRSVPSEHDLKVLTWARGYKFFSYSTQHEILNAHTDKKYQEFRLFMLH